MRASLLIRVPIVVLALLLTEARTASAQTADSAQALRSEIDKLRQDFDALRQQYGDRLTALEARLSALDGTPQVAPAPTTAPPQAVATPEPPAVVSRGGGGVSNSKVFNPDIGMIGNFISATGKSRGGSESIAPIPFATLQESEASFQAVVDPYARADFFLALGEEGIEVEEGYVTFPTLPGGLLLKAGKMRANFGRLNAFHNHTLPWIDRPLAMYNLLGGSPLDPDTGIKDAGVSVSRLIPAGKLFVEATGEVFRGDSGTVFKSNRRSDFSTIGHLRAYADFTEGTNIEIGGSYARGHNELGSDFVTQLYSTDVTLRWRPLRRAIYRSLAARSELFWSHRQEPTVVQEAFGGYASVDYGFRRRWFAGGRIRDRKDNRFRRFLGDRPGRR